MGNVTFQHNGRTYVMSVDEIEAAYEYRKHQNLLSDAQNHLKELCVGWNLDGYDPGCEPEDEDTRNALDDFKMIYGMTFDEALQHLEAYVIRFQCGFNQELTEDEQWEYAIRRVLEDFTGRRRK